MGKEREERGKGEEKGKGRERVIQVLLFPHFKSWHDANNYTVVEMKN